MFRPSGTPEPKVTSPMTGLSLDYRRMKNGRWPKLQRFFTGHKDQLPCRSVLTFSARNNSGMAMVPCPSMTTRDNDAGRVLWPRGIIDGVTGLIERRRTQMKERAFELRGGGGQQLNVATGATLCSLPRANALLPLLLGIRKIRRCDLRRGHCVESEEISAPLAASLARMERSETRSKQRLATVYEHARDYEAIILKMAHHVGLIATQIPGSIPN
ncbi:hypothetical protein BC629DRAFT_1440209 [Irpex lacteus]|nr:hypothetical protein BC629DRAFT_1440209 [Irpex lacteus]